MVRVPVSYPNPDSTHPLNRPYYVEANDTVIHPVCGIEMVGHLRSIKPVPLTSEQGRLSGFALNAAIRNTRSALLICNSYVVLCSELFLSPDNSHLVPETLNDLLLWPHGESENMQQMAIRD